MACSSYYVCVIIDQYIYKKVLHQQNKQLILIMTTFVRKHKSAHKKSISPLTPASQIIDPQNIHAKQLQFEQTSQHSRWSELRDKMKSMQLNRIQVTSYRSRNSYSQQRHLQNFKSEPKLSVNVNNKSNKNNEQHQNQLFNKLDLKHIGTQRIFSSKSKKSQGKLYKNLPYYEGIYKKQGKNKLQISLRNLGQKREIVNENPQNELNLNQIQRNTNQLSKQIKPKNRSGKHRNRHCRTSASHHKTNNYKIFSDLIYFNKIQPQDFTQRMVVRRKSNVIGDCIQAIQASILKGKIILFMVDVTTGSPNNKKVASHRASYKNISQIPQSTRQKSQINSVPTNSIPFQSHQSQLMMGPNQINQYLQIIGLSYHPIQLEASTVKLASILVDFLIIEETTLRFDKNQISLFFVNSQNEDKQQMVKQAQILLSKSQLVRLLNPHKRKGNKIKYNFSHNNISNNIKSQKSKQIHDGMEYYKVYGHPHPAINGPQYEQIMQFQESHPENHSKRIQSSKESKGNKGITEDIAPDSTQVRNNNQNDQIQQNMQNSTDAQVLLPHTIQHKSIEQIGEQNSQFIKSQNLLSEKVMEESHIKQMGNSSIKQENMSQLNDQTQVN